MGKFLNSFIVFVFCFIIMEYVLYIKDYSELLVISNYIKYDIGINNLQSIYNEKYFVYIDYENDVISYEIVYNRDSLFNIERLKKISYRRVIE